MEFINWHDSFSIGLRIIDDQHQQLFTLINELIRAVNTHQEDEALDKILHSLLAYTEMHFRTEEEVFKIHPQFKAHFDTHLQFAESVKILAADFTENVNGVAVNLLNNLREWLQNHILKTDIINFFQ